MYPCQHAPTLEHLLEALYDKGNPVARRETQSHGLRSFGEGGSRATEQSREEVAYIRRVISVLAIAALIAAMTAVGALPAFAQQPGPPTLTATGVLGAPFFEGQDPEPLYPLTDEATGTTYTLIGSFVDVTPFVGQRVTIQGVPVPGIDPSPSSSRRYSRLLLRAGARCPAPAVPRSWCRPWPWSWVAVSWGLRCCCDAGAVSSKPLHETARGGNQLELRFPKLPPLAARNGVQFFAPRLSPF